MVLCVTTEKRIELRGDVTSLRFTEDGGCDRVGGAATTIDGVISTRRGNAGSWAAMIGKSPAGVWELLAERYARDPATIR